MANIPPLPYKNPKSRPPYYKGLCSSCRHKTIGYDTDNDPEQKHAVPCCKVFTASDGIYLCIEVNTDDACQWWQGKRWANLGSFFRVLFQPKAEPPEKDSPDPVAESSPKGKAKPAKDPEPASESP